MGRYITHPNPLFFFVSRSLIMASKIVVFSWDDTLYPTTFYRQNRADFDSKSLTKLSASILLTLSKYILVFGQNHVFIVTNASRSWIFKSLHDMVIFCNIHHIQHSFGLILQMISQQIIKTISAKDD